MNNTYNFLKNVWKEVKDQNKENKTLIPFLLLIISLPISLGVSNFFLALFFSTSLYYSKKKLEKPSLFLIVPILLFVWICFSYYWSIDIKKTLDSIPKEIALIIIPLSFYLIPKYTKFQKEIILKYYSYSILIYVAYFFIRACIRFLIFKDTGVFFYHGPDNYTDTGLVPRLLNAIHFSVFVSVAFFYFFNKEVKTISNQLISIVLFVFIILLSSKNIIIVFVLLVIAHFLYYSKTSNKLRLKNIFILLFLLLLIVSFSKIKNRFLVEFQSNSKNSLSHSVYNEADEGMHYISIYEAWNNKVFKEGDYFPGTAFRVYQFRLFTEFLEEEPIFIKGFGYNASQNKLLEKEKKYNLYHGYGLFNFHNQYIQIFAELGIVGFLLLILLLLLNIKNAIKHKDFIHIVFSVLMISLFLTESFLWRQRGVVFFTLFYCLFNSFYKKER